MSEGTPTLHVTIDAEACQGHARCAATAPEVFVLDDLGYAVGGTRPVPEGHQGAVRRAAASCPEGAITVSGGTERGAAVAG